MEDAHEIKNIISHSQNILISFPKDKEEPAACALALFYTLKELDKNVNLATEELPEKLKFLTPSLEYISYPKEITISLPKERAEVSQIRYDNTEKDLKIHLSLNNGSLKKSDVNFSFEEAKPELLITIGINDIAEVSLPPAFTEEEEDGPIVINIAKKEENQKFGRINIVNQDKSLVDLVFSFIKTIDSDLSDKKISTSLLAGIILASDNLKQKNISLEMLETSTALIKSGATREEIIENIYNKAS